MAPRKRTWQNKRGRKRRRIGFWKSKAGKAAKVFIIFGVVIALLSAAVAVNLIKKYGLVDDAKQVWHNIISSGIESEGFKREKGKKVVCIDPGHGFDDAGAASAVKGKEVLYERDINADVCVRVKEILEENKAQRHIRGGLATKQKYAKPK